MPKKVRFYWQQVAEEYEIDFQDVYYRRIGGEAWKTLCGELSEICIKRLTKEWCADMGIDPESVERKNLEFGIISDPKRVDSGRAKALRDAGWDIKNIAIDCHCTEECVKEIFNAAG